MDRTVYYNAETCSTFSEESYQQLNHHQNQRSSSKQSSPVVSSRSASTFNRLKIVQPGLMRKSADLLGKAINDKLVNNQQSRNTNNRVVIQQQQQQFNNVNRNNYSISDKVQDRPLTKKLIHTGISKIAMPRSSTEELLSSSSPELNYGGVLVLHLQCKHITAMTLTSLDPFYNLKNLYLYKNSIRRIQGLDNLVNLELLDLSRNNVERIDNLDKCKRLRKLYLGFNEIQVVEGLENLNELEELLIDDQDIPPEQPLIFIPGVMEAIGHCLQLIDVSSNQLDTLAPLSNLQALNTLISSNNLLDNLDETAKVLETLPNLTTLVLKGNPLSSKPGYKSKMIGAVWKLMSLDNKEIPDSTRTCVQKLRMFKHAKERKREQAQLISQLKNETLITTSAAGASCPYKLDPNYIDFNFSTPTRCSPVQLLQRGGGVTAFEYEGRSGYSESDEGSSDQMSDMARIIFRLSNLDNEHEGGGGDAKGTWWDQPGSSMDHNTNDVDEGNSSSGCNKKLLRPKPAGPGGKSVNGINSSSSERYVYGRVLSPLIEMPTPESLTARDEQ